jgi:hypothetical protein
MQIALKDVLNAAKEVVRMRRAVKQGDFYLKPDEVISGGGS